MTTTFQGLTLDQIRESAPAAMATIPAARMTDRYKFTSTLDLIDHMDTMGYKVTSARQSISKANPIYKDYGTHIIGFENPEFYMKNAEGTVEARPRIYLINDHCGCRPVQWEQGIFRLVCSNGLVIKSQDMGGFKERHLKYDLEGIKLIVDEKVQQMEAAVKKINQWVTRQMTEREMYQFATEALALRLEGDRLPERYEILGVLEARRPIDAQKNLWTVMNVVQENIIKGGFSLNEREARAIKNPIKDFNINQSLWQIAEKYSN